MSMLNESDNLDHMHEESQFSLQNDHATPKRGRQQSFTREEDLLLISSYLHTSNDPVIGNGQKQDAFWKRVHDSFVGDGKFNRTQVSISCRWNVINKDVSKFVGCYAQIQQQQQSGLNEQDRIIKAEALFKTSTGKNFQLLHCWNVLKSESRWSSASFYDRSNKSLKMNESASPSGASPVILDNINIGASPAAASPSDSIILGEDADETNMFDRPMGRKAAKKLRKNKDKDHNTTTLDSTSILQTWHDENYIENERLKKERIEKQLQYQEKYLEIEEKKWNSNMMMIDTTGMDEIRATYFKRIQQQILNDQSKILQEDSTVNP